MDGQKLKSNNIVVFSLRPFKINTFRFDWWWCLWAAGRTLGACADRSGHALTFSSLGGRGGAGVGWVVVWSFAAAVRSATFALYPSEMASGSLASPLSARPPVQETRDAARGEGSRCDTNTQHSGPSRRFPSPPSPSSPVTHSPLAVKRTRTRSRSARTKNSGSRARTPLSADPIRAASLRKVVQNVRRDIIPSQRDRLRGEGEREEKNAKNDNDPKTSPRVKRHERERGREKFPQKKSRES